MEADHFVSKFGADILRLWVASVDWETEVPFGEGLLNRLPILLQDQKTLLEFYLETFMILTLKLI